MIFKTKKLEEPTDAGATRLTNLQLGIEAKDRAVTGANAELQEVRSQIETLQREHQIAFSPFGAVTHCELPSGSARAGLDLTLRELKQRLTAATKNFNDALSERAGLIEALREETCRR
jgi:hypothetical protein